RFLVVFILSFLLLNPMIRHTVKEVEKPLIFIACDNSSSVISLPDSNYYKTELPAKLAELRAQLANQFETVFYNFGSSLKKAETPDYTEKTTDISSVFSEFTKMYGSPKSGAIIIATDGLYNIGKNPLYATSGINLPVYSIALGDTQPRMDLSLTRIMTNKYAYLGNKFPVEISVDAWSCQGKSFQLTVTQSGKEVFRKEITAASDKFHQAVGFTLDATKSGIQQYHASLSLIEGEVAVSNNYRDFFIEVLDSRQKILILYSSPHPDVAAIKETLDANDNYETESADISKFQGNVKQYDLIILHQLPATDNRGAQVLKNIQTAALPTLYIVGKATSLPQLNALKPGLTISANKTGMNESSGIPERKFPLFTLSEEAWKSLSSSAPLQSFFGQYNVSPTSSILLYQRIGSVSTQQPLVSFNQAGLQKNGVIAGTGIWRWKLRDFAQNGNHNIFNELIGKMVQYLAVTTDKSQFRVNGKVIFREDEPVVLDAELYNESYELINDADVEIDILDQDDKRYHFAFGRTVNAYRLNAGTFAVGTYKYTAKTTIRGATQTTSGVFTVQPMQLESERLVADHQVLFGLAEKTGGKVFYPANIGQIQEVLAADPNMKPVSFERKEYQDIITWKIIFFLVISLLAVEWIVRKRSGSY
ncbi:MAG: hypothetical protein KKD31_12075, partial [Bacteroidetes bacterium]|nr:hypothetical protein [Bacteroidota bacterium]